jgi:hypothetical protein
MSMCKVCNEPAPLYGVTDFNKSCEERRGRYLPLTGVPVYYNRCDACGLIFTTAFDHWSRADYLQHIYNDDYVLVDPDYIDSRPAGNAAFILDFIKKGHALRCLDYGGGNGRLMSLLREGGVDAHSWDPMDEEGCRRPAHSLSSARSKFWSTHPNRWRRSRKRSDC